jgi:predicted hotdog family 3-hydroxylacyl-ACP dehydratase
VWIENDLKMLAYHLCHAAEHRVHPTPDKLWACHGVLGAELGLPSMANAVYVVSGLVYKLSCPVIYM